MKQKTLVRSLLGLFAVSGVTAAMASLHNKTMKKIDLADQSQNRPRLSHSFGISRTVTTQIAEPIPFTGAIVRAACSVVIYDMSNVPITQNGTIQCDVHMGMLHLILPSTVNIAFNAKEQFGTCTCTDDRAVTINAPVITVRGSAFMGMFSVTKKAPQETNATTNS